jgi:hypothetical protein
MSLPTPEEVQALVADLSTAAQAYSTAPDLEGYMSRVQLIAKARQLSRALITPDQAPNYHGLNVCQEFIFKFWMRAAPIGTWADQTVFWEGMRTDGRINWDPQLYEAQGF